MLSKKVFERNKANLAALLELDKEWIKSNPYRSGSENPHTHRINSAISKFVTKYVDIYYADGALVDPEEWNQDYHISYGSYYGSVDENVDLYVTTMGENMGEAAVKDLPEEEADTVYQNYGFAWTYKQMK